MSFLQDIDRTRVPGHVAIVMDGNGRWATQRGLPRTEGHGAGEDALWDTVKGAVEVGVGWLAAARVRQRRRLRLRKIVDVPGHFLTIKLQLPKRSRRRSSPKDQGPA